MYKNLKNEEIDEKIETIISIIKRTEEECTKKCVIRNGRRSQSEYIEENKRHKRNKKEEHQC